MKKKVAEQLSIRFNNAMDGVKSGVIVGAPGKIMEWME